jgi:glycosyltransferase involved in cell wall biosynthesis
VDRVCGRVGRWSCGVKVLQLSSDWKWTGPAAPMLQLLLAQRELGHEVELACAEAGPETDPSLAGQARAAGVSPLLTLDCARGVSWRRDTPDVLRLRALLEERRFEVVHVWHTRDHVLALRAASRLRRAGRVRVVRSVKSALPIRNLPWNRWLFGPGSDGLVCVSPDAARGNVRLRGGRPLLGAFGAVDLERFQPGPPDPEVPKSLSLEPGHRVVGIVARAQRHRRFDLLLEAAARLVAADPATRLLVVGRGTHIRTTAHEPAARLGIADRVIFAGYRGDDYPDVLRCIDVFTFLVPGSDGGCRALLEAAACGLPAVATRRGALPEIVVDGETGLLVEERVDALAAAWRALLDEPRRRKHMGAAARQRALRHFDPIGLAEQVIGLYRETFRIS